MRFAPKIMLLLLVSAVCAISLNGQTVINVRSTEQYNFYYNNFVSKEIKGNFTYSTIIKTTNFANAFHDLESQNSFLHRIFFRSRRSTSAGHLLLSSLDTFQAMKYNISLKYRDSIIFEIKDYILLRFSSDSALMAFRIPTNYINFPNTIISIYKSKEHIALIDELWFNQSFSNRPLLKMYKLGRISSTLNIYPDKINEEENISRFLSFTFTSNPAPANMYFILATTFDQVSRNINFDNEETIKRYSNLSLGGKKTNITLTLPEKNFYVFFVQNGKITRQFCVPKYSTPLNNTIDAGF